MGEFTKAIGIYGEGSSTKTSQLYHFAKWYYERHRKQIRYVTCDAGGEPFTKAGLVDLGVVDYWDITERQDKMMSTLRQLSEGYWYRTTKDGRKVMDKQQVFMTTAAEWEKIGCVMFEGGTKVATLMKRGISSAEPTEKKRAFDKPFDYVEEGYSFGGVANYHIGLIQTTVLDCMVRMKRNLPVDYMLWTFHAGRGENKQNKETLIGPKIEGQAVTAEVSTDLMELLHMCREDVRIAEPDGTTTVEQRVMMYYEDHPDQTTGLPCKAKCRIPPEEIATVKAKWPNGCLVMSPDRGIVDYLNYVETLEGRTRANVNSWFQNLQNGNATMSAPVVEVPEIRTVTPIRRSFSERLEAELNAPVPVPGLGLGDGLSSLVPITTGKAKSMEDLLKEL